MHPLQNTTRGIISKNWGKMVQLALRSDHKPVSSHSRDQAPNPNRYPETRIEERMLLKVKVLAFWTLYEEQEGVVEVVECDSGGGIGRSPQVH